MFKKTLPVVHLWPPYGAAAGNAPASRCGRRRAASPGKVFRKKRQPEIAGDFGWKKPGKSGDLGEIYINLLVICFVFRKKQREINEKLLEKPAVTPVKSARSTKFHHL